jgi:hypothetical protein
MGRRSLAVSLLLLAALACCAEDKDAASGADTTAGNGGLRSDLWGRGGERWTAASRLPDVSFAGYQRGE